MLNYIWFGMIAASVICAAATGRLEALSTAIMNGAQQAVELSFFFTGQYVRMDGVFEDCGKKWADRTAGIRFFSRDRSAVSGVQKGTGN